MNILPAIVKGGWVVCPVCGKRQFKLYGSEKIKNLKYRCKLSRASATNLGGLSTKIKGLNTNFNLLTSNSNKLFKSTNNLTAGFAKMYAGVKALERGFDALRDSVSSSVGYIENLNYFNSAFNQVAEKAVSQWETAGADSADAYYESFSSRAKELTSQMTGFNINDDGTLTATGEGIQ